MELFCQFDASCTPLKFKQIQRSKESTKLVCKLPEQSKIKLLKLYAKNWDENTNKISFSFNTQQSEESGLSKLSSDLTDKIRSFELKGIKLKSLLQSANPLKKLEVTAVIIQTTEMNQSKVEAIGETPVIKSSKNKRKLESKISALKEVPVNTHHINKKKPLKETEKKNLKQKQSKDDHLNGQNNNENTSEKCANKDSQLQKDLKFVTVSSKPSKQNTPKSSHMKTHIEKQSSTAKIDKKIGGNNETAKSKKVCKENKTRDISSYFVNPPNVKNAQNNKKECSEVKARDISSYFLSNKVAKTKIETNDETNDIDDNSASALSIKEVKVSNDVKTSKIKNTLSPAVKLASDGKASKKKNVSPSSTKEDQVKLQHESTKQDIARYSLSLDSSLNDSSLLLEESSYCEKKPSKSPVMRKRKSTPSSSDQISSSEDNVTPIKTSRSKKKKTTENLKYDVCISDEQISKTSASEELEKISYQQCIVTASSLTSENHRKTPELSEAEQLKYVNEVTPLEAVITALSPLPTSKMTKKRAQIENILTPKSRKQRLAMSTLDVITPNKSTSLDGADEKSTAHLSTEDKSQKQVARCVDLSHRVPKPSARWGHSITYVGPTQAVLTGGQGDKQLSRDAVWTLNPETRLWQGQEVVTEGAKPEYRVGHSATFDPTMRCIYIYGGSKNTKWFHDVHMYDLDENKWSLVKYNGKAPTRAYHTATLFRHELWVLGGVFPRPDPQPDGCCNEVHIFSPVMEGWYEPIVTGEKPRPRSGHSATCLEDRLVVFGGWDFPFCYNDLHVLDLTTVDWSAPTVQGTPPKPRSWHASCALSYSRVFIHGGYDGDNALHDAFIFNLNTCSWQEVHLATPPSPRAGHTATLLPATHHDEGEDEVLVFGGGDNDGTYFSDLLSFYLPIEKPEFI